MFSLDVVEEEGRAWEAVHRPYPKYQNSRLEANFQNFPSTRCRSLASQRTGYPVEACPACLVLVMVLAAALVLVHLQVEQLVHWTLALLRLVDWANLAPAKQAVPLGLQSHWSLRRSHLAFLHGHLGVSGASPLTSVEPLVGQI